MPRRKAAELAQLMACQIECGDQRVCVCVCVCVCVYAHAHHTHTTHTHHTYAHARQHVLLQESICSGCVAGQTRCQMPDESAAFCYF